ncbi:Band 7 protein [Kalmanozyma brasiliensis GHG001]|uniref:Band 7 domain-containing protein n=1 Tax=Kalmanozyma brasiliensis (strain GHG001) TaxID=1365824 RepID=V5GRS1_KALBG|nr:Band 7 protein [Kalmanozyma brasiliensis GHG001]EST08612.1 Band 7 protein [Kalmanozyma brasiliensis GHG001]
MSELGNDTLPGSSHNGDAIKKPTMVSSSAARPTTGGLVTVQPLKRSEMQPSYKQNLGLETVEHGFYGSLINGIGAVAGCFGQLPFCFCCPNPYKEIEQGSVGLISRFGQFYRSEDPGLVQINPCSETLRRVDVKINTTPIPHQTAITRDSVSISAESVIFWHISNPYRASFGIADVRSALIERAQTTLRNVIGGRVLQSLVTDREQVALEVQEIVGDIAEKWGVQVESILIKDIVFSKELQESLSSAAKQKRIGESKVIAAQAEVDAARLMRQAADILASKSAMQIRALESLQAMAKTANSKVIFVPMNLNDLSGDDNLPPGGTGPGANVPPAAVNAASGSRSGNMLSTAALSQLAEM